MWKGQFGADYMDRNPKTGEEQDALCKKLYGVTFTDMIERFLGDLPRDISILEVGCGAGCNLELLRDCGFTNLHGIDVNPAVEGILYQKGFSQGKGNFWPWDITRRTFYTDNRFDLVFTAGVLIHLRAYRKAMKEMARITNRYIWGLEYYSSERERIPYDVGCWKDNYSQKWMDMGFKLVCRCAYPYVADCGKPNPRVDEIYLLEKA